MNDMWTGICVIAGGILLGGGLAAWMTWDNYRRQKAVYDEMWITIREAFRAVEERRIR